MKARILSTPRELVYIVLLAFVAFSLTLSYQLNSISIILLAVFYLCDKNLISKVKGLSFTVAYFYLIYFIIHVLGLLITENMQEGLKEVTVKLSNSAVSVPSPPPPPPRSASSLMISPICQALPL